MDVAFESLKLQQQSYSVEDGGTIKLRPLQVSTGRQLDQKTSYTRACALGGKMDRIPLLRDFDDQTFDPHVAHRSGLGRS